MLDIRDPVSRVSLDTFYQVSFSFGNFDQWFKQNAPNVNSGAKRAAGAGFHAPWQPSAAEPGAAQSHAAAGDNV